MNETVNRFLLAGDKLMPEMHLKQSEFTYSACGPFTKNKETIQKAGGSKDSRYIYRNEPDKGCFQDDLAYGDFKHLARRTNYSDHSTLLKIQNMMDTKEVLLLWFIIFLIKSPRITLLLKTKLNKMNS